MNTLEWTKWTFLFHRTRRHKVRDWISIISFSGPLLMDIYMTVSRSLSFGSVVKLKSRWVVRLATKIGGQLSNGWMRRAVASPLATFIMRLKKSRLNSSADLRAARRFEASGSRKASSSEKLRGCDSQQQERVHACYAI